MGSSPLSGGFDVERAVAGTPDSARTKGMFFRPLRAELGADFDALAPKLVAPPRSGRYLPFIDYCSRDHVRLIDAVARKRFPQLSPREAHRRLGAESFDEFARSTIGRVTFGLLRGDVLTTLMRFGDGYALLVKGTREVRCLERGESAVEIVFGYTLALPEYVLGILEAIVRTREREPRISIRQERDGTHFDVQWS